MQEYEAKINEKNNEIANFQAESVSRGIQALPPEELQSETAELIQELMSERNIREKLMIENAELEADLNRYKVEYEGQIASLTVENEELTARIAALENETVEQEEQLQDALKEAQEKEAELRRLKDLVAMDSEGAQKLKEIEAEFINPDTPKEGAEHRGEALKEDYVKL